MAAPHQATEYQQRHTGLAQRLEAEAVDRYTNQHQTVRQIATTIGCSYGKVYTFLQRSQVHMRPKGRTPATQVDHPGSPPPRCGGARAVPNPRRPGHRR